MSKISASFHVLFLASLFGVLASCSGNTEKRGILDYMQAIPLKGERLAGAETPMAPQTIVLVGENLFLVDKYADKMISRIPVQHPEMQSRIVSVGKGPGEYLRIAGISVCDSGDRIVLNDDMSRKLVSYPATSGQLSAEDIIGELNYGGNENLYSAVPFQDGFLASGCFGNDLFAVMDRLGQTGVTFGTYPGSSEEVGTHEFMMKNQMLLAVDRDNEYFVTAGVFNDWIAFYRFDGERVHLVKEYFSYDSDLEVLSFQAGVGMSYAIQEIPETMRAYRYLYPAESDLFALYWGIKSDRIGAEGNVCYVLQFGYDGELKSIFRMDEMLRTLAVDENSRTIYAVTFSSSDQEYIKTYTY